MGVFMARLKRQQSSQRLSQQRSNTIAPVDLSPSVASRKCSGHLDTASTDQAVPVVLTVPPEPAKSPHNSPRVSAMSGLSSGPGSTIALVTTTMVVEACSGGKSLDDIATLAAPGGRLTDILVKSLGSLREREKDPSDSQRSESRESSNSPSLASGSFGKSLASNNNWISQPELSPPILEGTEVASGDYAVRKSSLQGNVDDDTQSAASSAPRMSADSTRDIVNQLPSLGSKKDKWSRKGKSKVKQQQAIDSSDIDVQGQMMFERELSACLKPRAFKRGEVIINKGDIGSEMYFIKQGQAAVVSRDKSIIYAVLKAGSFFGEIGVLFPMPRTASVVALTHCLLSVLTKEALNTLLLKYPDIMERFTYVANERLRVIETNKELSTMVANLTGEDSTTGGISVVLNRKTSA